HADVRVNKEFGRLRDGAACLRVVGANDPNALRRADFCTNPAGCTANFLLSICAFIVNQKRHITEFFRHRQFFFGILHGEDAASFCAGTMGNALIIVVAASPPGDVIKISINETFERYAETFEYSFAIHNLFSVFYRSSSPSTMSITPRIATKSAIFCPTHIFSSAVMLMKDGARTW